jgi:4-diphosphocytidyl-2C-methyl-D-erythritol kinase
VAWGRGERLLALRPPRKRVIALIVPAFGVTTKEAFGWLEGPRASSATLSDAGILKPAALSDWKRLLPLAENDFEPVVTTRHPIIADLVEGLRGMGCAPAMMSGSGSVVFGVMPEHFTGGIHFRPDGDDPPLVRGLTTASADRVEPVLPLD